jgi:hypothetical protein
MFPVVFVAGAAKPNMETAQDSQEGAPMLRHFFEVACLQEDPANLVEEQS